MKTIRVGGVPEHFNSPWHQAIESKIFEAAGVKVQWTTIDTGTGAMCKALAAGEIDMAVALTEGVVADIAKGGDHRIVSTYIDSPLEWGVHVDAKHGAQAVADLKGKVFGVSRYGSGSHLMAYMQARALKWDTKSDLSFAIVGNMKGAKSALEAGTADAYMWEKWTTKPFVDAGYWRRVGVFPTPWPCFVVTASRTVLDNDPTAVQTVMAVVAGTAATFQANAGGASVAYASSRYSLKPDDTATWFKDCRWHTDSTPSIAEATLSLVLESLVATDVLTADQAAASPPARLVSPVTSLVSDAVDEKDMPATMYNWRVRAIENALAARGKARGALSVDDLVALGHLDQYHYLGTDACDHAMQLLGLTAAEPAGEHGRSLLDVGSGIGGPARYFAHRSGCSVTGIELQADLVEAATRLTQRCEGLRDRVKFTCGDATAPGALGKSVHDHFISLLVFLHIPPACRERLFRSCHEALKPGGTFVIEDFCRLRELTQLETQQLRTEVAATSVFSPDEYRADLEAAGFVDVCIEDMTPQWVPWTEARHRGYVASKDKTIAMHGEQVFTSREHFYGVIRSLFTGGGLGGVRITGRRPGTLEAALKEGRRHIVSDGPRKRAKVLETGERMADVLNGSGASGANSVGGFGLRQPSFPAGDFHDSLQYHFFAGPICLAGRVFHTSTLQHHSAWMHDERTGKTSVLCEVSEPMTKQSDDGMVDLMGTGMSVRDGAGVGHLKVKGVTADFTWKESDVFEWQVPGQKTAVIHRPRMSCTLKIKGDVFQGDGYCKRYFGPDYGPCWGYRFIMGYAAAPGTDYVPGQVQDSITVWTADATFGDHKYNYWKVRDSDGHVVAAQARDTWQQADAAYAIVDGTRCSAEVETLGEWWSCDITNTEMKSRMQQRYCRLRVTHQGRVYEGRALNERCFGTLG